jgi:hypothetical protein
MRYTVNMMTVYVTQHLGNVCMYLFRELFTIDKLRRLITEANDFLIEFSNSCSTNDLTT